MSLAPALKKQKTDTECPYDAKAESAFTPTVKAYKNSDFLNSRAARSIRIMAEFEETRTRLRSHHIEGTILIFGSARSMFQIDYDREKAKVAESIKTEKDVSKRAVLEAKLARLDKSAWMCEWCDKAEELSRKLTAWLMTPAVRMGDEIPEHTRTPKRPKKPTAPSAESGVLQRMPPSEATRYLVEDKKRKYENPDDYPQQYVICTGGGPGLMEAANKGAASVPGAKSMGMGISLPFEEGLNKYVNVDLAFEFHYFFTRKFWMVYQARCIIVFPGGFGTLDEFFEACTLKQTGKLSANVPVVLFGKTYWQKIINWQAMADLGTISQGDIDAILFTDSVEEAYTHIVSSLKQGSVNTSL